MRCRLTDSMFHGVECLMGCNLFYGLTRLLGIHTPALPARWDSRTRLQQHGERSGMRRGGRSARGEDAFREDGVTPGESRTGPLPCRGENAHRSPLWNVMSLFVTSLFWQPGSFAKQPAAMTVRIRRRRRRCDT